MRRLVPFLVFLAACGGTAEGAPTTIDDAAVSTTPGSTAAPDQTSATEGEATATTTTSQCPTSDSDRPGAPDFTLELGDGGSYTLSDGCQPVYLVFWAEW